MAKGNPHLEEQDGCDHGATGKACVVDPSPNGKDCLAHGKHGGINENHCLTEEEPPTTTTTTTTPARVCAAVDLCPPAQHPETVPTPEGTQCTTPDGHPYQTSYSECPPPTTETVTAATPSVPVSGAELAYTGATADVLGGLALALVAVGTAIRVVARRGR